MARVQMLFQVLEIIFPGNLSIGDLKLIQMALISTYFIIGHEN